MTRAWLVRHAEVVSYEGDHGLTDRGVAQAQAAAPALAARLGSAPVALRHADSGRARETAQHLGDALRAHGTDLAAPVVDPGFDNFSTLVAGAVRRHDAMRPALAQAREQQRPGPPADWEHEAERFAAIHDGGGDPITWWLTQPTLTLEPAARVVRRFWRALAALAREDAGDVVVCTHSGPMRALAAYALQHDPGEPEHVETLEVRLAGHRAGDSAELRFRGHTVALTVPALEEPAWP
jgi:broad specificity phosphatase PhoE